MKININEFKIKLLAGVESLIDTYFAGGGISDRLINATVKIIVNQNIDKLDGFIELFADKNGQRRIYLQERGRARERGGDCIRQAQGAAV